MKKLPIAEIYRFEMRFMPWGKLLDIITKKIANEVKFGGKIIDLMCGPGYLLDELYLLRPDIEFVGIDIDKRYINYARKNNPNILFIHEDIRKWTTVKKFDCVICTSGVHHLLYQFQPELLSKMSQFMNKQGFAICAECCLEKSPDEQKRKLHAAKLDYEYLKEIIKRGAPKSIIQAMLDILQNDVLENGEYKISINRLMEMTQKVFSKVEVMKTWPTKQSQYGDYYLILKN